MTCADVRLRGSTRLSAAICRKNKMDALIAR
jgi:hypothetical protein